MKELNNHKQGSIEWHEAKLGKVGGTRLKKVFGSTSLDLIDELIAEIGSGESEDVYVNAAMQRGKDLEPVARKAFTALRNVKIDEIGLCISDEFPNNVCSPDGFSKDRAIGIEIKCPSTKKHVQTIRQNQIPNEYKYQVLNYFLVNEKCETVYFISFDTRYSPKPYFEVKLNRADCEGELETIRQELIKFWAKFDKYLKLVNKF
jgi:putative phage-type endonuclease